MKAHQYWASKTSPKLKAQRQAEKEADENLDPTVKRMRVQLHNIIDPIWKNGLMSRATIYKRLGRAVGNPNFHARTLFDAETGVKVLGEATKIYSEVINRQYSRKRRK